MRIFDQGNPVPSSAKIAEYKRTYNLSESDNVTVFIVPKGQAGRRRGRFLFRNMSARANRLQSDVYALKRKIKAVEISDLSIKEKQKKLSQLRGTLEYTSYKLNAEMAALPLSGYIVDEENE